MSVVLQDAFATRFLTLGLGNTFQLQHFLGHTSLEMVRRYVSAASVEKSNHGATTFRHGLDFVEATIDRHDYSWLTSSFEIEDVG